jgi:hypothetical protein
MTTVLRICGMAVAVAALVDPSVRLKRDLPLTVRVHVDENDADGVAVRDRLARSLSSGVQFRDDGTPAAVVAIQDDALADLPSPIVPMSTVSVTGNRDVAVIDAPSTVSMPAGTVVNLRLQLFGRGVQGTTSTVVVEEDGVELGQVEHAWTQDGYARVSVPYLAADAGSRRVTIRVRRVDGESRLLNNAADVNVLATARPVRVAVVEARPSWPAGFVRRALEDDPAFQVSSILRLSNGVSARTGDVARELARHQLDPFDVVLIGAPEELRRGELGTLREFAATRGGTVVLLPDTRAAGEYRTLLPGVPAEELLRQPQPLAPAGLMASEVLYLRDVTPVATVLAESAKKAIVVSWPAGDGRFVFSGALDAWRYRAAPSATFSQFWKQTVLSAGLAAPPRIAIALSPAVIGRHQRSRVTVRLRRTEFSDLAKAVTVVPAVSASIVDASGESEMIRLWPTAELGVFEGDVSAGAVGLHNIRVAADNGVTADSVLMVADGAATARWPRMTDIPQLTRGVAVRADDLEPLIRLLSSMPRQSQPELVHPMRSAWWMIPFAGTLCAEWLIRRRRSER